MPELLTAQESGFEVPGPTGWEPFDADNVSVARTTSQAHSGIASMQYTTITLSGITDARQLTVQPARFISAVAGELYEASCWALATDLFVGRGASITLAFADALGVETATFNDTSTAIDEWSELSCSGVAPVGSVRVIPYIAFGGAYSPPESDQWIDDVSLIGPVPALLSGARPPLRQRQRLVGTPRMRQHVR